MLLTPENHAFNIKNPPRLVLALCLLLGLIFLFWHSADRERGQELEQRYVSGLLATEWPLYETHLLKTRQSALLTKLQADYAGKDYAPIARQMAADAAFVQSTQPEHMDVGAFQPWKVARADFDKEHGKLSAYALGLNPQQFRPITFVTYQLVEQNAISLIGNILLLLVAGIALELALGGGAVLGALLVGGVVGGLGFLAFNSSSVFPLGSASTGVAAVVGMFLMQFRREKLRLLGGNVVITGWVVLGLWLAKEAAEFLLVHHSIGVLVPHLLGLASAPLVWLAFERWFKAEAVVEVEESVDMDLVYREQLDQALQSIGRMDFVDAKKRLRELVKAYPQDLRVLEQLYKLEKLEPASDTFEAVARRLFNLSNTDDAAQVCLSIYRDYSKLSETQRALDTDTCLKLVMRFARLGEVKDAEKLIKQVLDKQAKSALLPKAAHALSQAYERLQDNSRAEFYKEMAAS